MTPEEKIKLARKLLHEATCEIRRNEKKADDNELCRCGHKRRYHSVRYSTNYTGGICFECECMNFIVK